MLAERERPLWRLAIVALVAFALSGAAQSALAGWISDQSLCVIVRDVGGETFSVNVNHTNATVANLKDKIVDIKHHPLALVHLVFGGQELAGNGTLSEHGVQPGSTIDLMLREPKPIVYVDTPDQGRLKFELALSERLFVLQDKIMMKGYVYMHQRIIFNNEQLSDDTKPLSFYKITDGSVLTLLIVPEAYPVEKVFVKTPEGRVLEINIDPRDTVASLKVLVNKETAVSPVKQKLTFSGQQLEGVARLSSYGLEDGSNLELEMLD